MQELRPVFQFQDPVQYLQFRYLERRRRDPTYSMSAWARRLGYENPSFLFQVLKRERALKMNLVPRLARDLGLKGRALRYFECIVLQHSAKSEAERKMYGSLARQARPRKQREVEELELEAFTPTSDWVHAAIVESIHLGDFREDTAFLRERFGSKVSRRALKAAIDALLATGRLERDGDGHLRRGKGSSTLLKRREAPTEAIRAFHLQMIDLARAAVHEQSVDERFLHGTTIPIKRENYARAVEIIVEAHRKLVELGAEDGADDVYQLNSQFFRLTAGGTRSGEGGLLQ